MYTLIFVLMIIVMLTLVLSIICLVQNQNNNDNQNINIQKYVNQYDNQYDNQNNNQKYDGQNNNQKYFMWVYWENVGSADTPDYIKICLDSVKKYCSHDFELVILNEKSVHDYIPELKLLNLNNLLIAQKVDIIRVLLLYKYGGIYIDADTIVMRSPKEIVDKLIDYDYVGFGCTGNKCNYGYGRPSNGVMASRKDGVLISKIKDNLLGKILDKKKWEYFDLGKYIIWEELDKLMDNGYKYYHYSNDYDGTRDKYGNWIETSKLFSADPIEYNDERKLLFVIMYNSQMDDIRNLDKNYLLNSDLNISKYMKKSLYGSN